MSGRKSLLLLALLALVLGAWVATAGGQEGYTERARVAAFTHGCRYNSEFLRTYENLVYQEADTASFGCVVSGPATVTVNFVPDETDLLVNFGVLLRIPSKDGSACTPGQYSVVRQKVYEGGKEVRVIEIPEGWDCLVYGNVVFDVLGEDY